MDVDVKQLQVWQKAIALCEAIYQATHRFPDDERFGLTTQMRRAAVSIPSNLAEGYGRGTRRDYRQFVRIARGSAFEVETQIIVAQRLGFLTDDAANVLVSQVREVLRMLNGLIRSLGESRSGS
jgi:four helix bundle protein